MSGGYRNLTKLVITETPGDWFPAKATELDALHAFYDSKRDEPLNKAFLEQVPRRPSEYMGRNVYFGASFASRYEVEQALLHGLDSQLLWDSDYPHLEGTFVYPDGRDMPSVTRLALCDPGREDATNGRRERDRRPQPRRGRAPHDRQRDRRPDR
jgi:hypothetical protein